MAKKEYPPFFERAIPIALAALGIMVVVLLGVIFVVLFTGMMK